MLAPGGNKAKAFRLSTISQKEFTIFHHYEIIYDFKRYIRKCTLPRALIIIMASQFSKFLEWFIPQERQ